MYHAKELTLPLPHTSVDYITFGKGTKPLVMIQGLNTRSINGAAQMLSLAYRSFGKAYKVYLFDRRQNVQDGVTVQDFAADIAAAMDALGIQNAYVFGVSLGGMIAMHLAIDRPDLVQKLVLAVTTAQNTATLEQTIRTWTTMTQNGAYKALVRDMAQRLYSPQHFRRYKPFLPLLTLLQKPKDPARFIALANACLTCTAHESLQDITCPTLVLGGGEDRIIGANAATSLADALGCERYIYDRLGHAAYEEAKDFNRRVLSFFADK